MKIRVGFGFDVHKLVTDGWYNSTGHRNNMISAEYTSAAVVCYYSPNSAYGYYWVTVFVG